MPLRLTNRLCHIEEESLLTQYGYDPLRRLRSITDPRGQPCHRSDVSLR
jgi:YD repeat-containing protein